MKFTRTLMALSTLAVLAACNQPAGQGATTSAPAATTTEAAPAPADASGKPAEPAQSGGDKPAEPDQGGGKPE